MSNEYPLVRAAGRNFQEVIRLIENGHNINEQNGVIIIQINISLFLLFYLLF